MMEKLIGIQTLKGILKSFPKNMKFCFAYGSAAFKQKDNESNNMLDLIFVVRNVNQWHAQNLELNFKHYAQPLRFLGPRVISNVQEKWGAKVYYNTLVKMAGETTVKYGVISEVSLVEDLLDWNDLYLSGRLHKPVKILVEPDEHSQLPRALVQNLHSAVHAALLLLPQHFTEVDFYKTIAGLSYNGDFRMTFGENKDKINNIVLPQLSNFRELYSPILQHFENYVDMPKSDQGTVTCHQDTSPATKIHHLNQLPRTPQIKLVRAWSQGPRSKDTEDCLRAIAFDPECGEILEECLKDIVWRSSVTQSLKGIITAGFVKSVKYSAAKIMKMLQTNPQVKFLPKSEQTQSKVEKIVETVKSQAQAKETNKRIEASKYLYETQLDKFRCNHKCYSFYRLEELAFKIKCQYITMTTMDSDSESQDSDDGRRFRFEATRKDNVQPESKLGKPSRSNSEHKSAYEDIDHKDRKDRSKYESSRREHRSSKERDVDNRDLKHSAKYSKYAHESRNSRREDSKDYRNARDASVDAKGSALSSKRKTSDSKRRRNHDRSEHRKHRSQERSHNRNGDDRSQNDKYKNKSHEKYKHYSRDKSRDRSYQSHKTKSSDHGRFRGDSERHDSHKKASSKEDVDQHLPEFSLSKNGGQCRSDNESSTKKDSSVESQGCKELDLSEFDVLSETDENLSDDSDTKVKCLPSRHCKTKTKKRNANNEYENSTKKQAIESEYSEGSLKVNARKNDLLYGSSNNNSGAISDSTSPVLTEITEDHRDNVGERSEHISREKAADVTSKEENLSSLEKTSLRPNTRDSPEGTDLFTAENNSTYGPALPPQLIADPFTNIKSVKSTTFIGPCLPENDVQNVTERFEGDATSSSNQNNLSEEDPEMVFGPALPPHLLGKKCTEKEMKIIGPTLPSVTKSSDNDEPEQADSDNEDAIGPLPADHPALKSNYVYRQLEQRAQQIKSKQIAEDDSVLNQREEWMTELPPAQISNLGLAPRKFRVREGPDMSDRSCWTDTPAKKAEKLKQQEEEKLDTVITESSKESCETESGKSKKREKSLLEIHQSKLRKKKKKEEKKAKLTGETVRRPFDRDIDLQVNRFDQARKNTIISKAQYLDERFSRGKI
ncbi:uncharacterized protein LOC143186654 [Calliopsis andreniformis]|uniref:uncharacterized protein LOC143186654 n=1 Tax=Calliopsis andreniformis TaxID=337506 RepID=UPI003FCEDCC6